MTCLDDRRGDPCATCLAEDHPSGVGASKVVTANGMAFVPNVADQSYVGAFTRAAIERGRALLTKESK